MQASNRRNDQTASKMKLSGCVAGGLICKSQSWTKVK